MSRVRRERLLELAGIVTPRERQVVELVDRLRLVSHAQLAALLRDPTSPASPASQARNARGLLAGLTDQGVLARLQRRVGGVRAGSSGHIYYPGPVGQRLVAYWQGDGLTRGRVRPDPGTRYIRHRLGVTQLYVDVQLAVCAGRLDVLTFDVEPDCWRTSLDGLGGRTVLKPDAYLRVGLGAYEDRYFIEVDLGTESRPVLRRKLRAYLDYFNSGVEQTAEGIFPRVLLLTNSDARAESIVELCGRLPAESWHLFAVGRLERFIGLVTGQIEHAARRPVGGGAQ